MKVLRTTLFVLMGIMLMSVCAQAGDIDRVIAQARQNSRIVMLELGSAGCFPCEQMKPVMARLSKEYQGRMDVIFIDVKKEREYARRYGVHAIPTQVFLDSNGREFHRHIGYYAYEEIVPVLKNRR